QALRARERRLAVWLRHQESGDEGFEAIKVARAIEFQPNDFVAARWPTVPGTMHRDECVVAVLPGELLAFVKYHLHRRRVRIVSSDGLFRKLRPTQLRHVSRPVRRIQRIART